jgi:hypothetical protein
MLLLYKNTASMPDFILTIEEAQKKAKRAKIPILDIELAMYAATSMLQSGDCKKEANKWEGRDANMKTGPSGNRPTWPRTPGESTTSMPGLQMNHSPKRKTTSCPLPLPT